MKVISVYFDDHDKPLIGRILVEDHTVHNVVHQLEYCCKEPETFKIEVESGDSITQVTKRMREIVGD